MPQSCWTDSRYLCEKNKHIGFTNEKESTFEIAQNRQNYVIYGQVK